jgi:hypothetical protein
MFGKFKGMFWEPEQGSISDPMFIETFFIVLVPRTCP